MHPLEFGRVQEPTPTGLSWGREWDSGCPPGFPQLLSFMTIEHLPKGMGLSPYCLEKPEASMRPSPPPPPPRTGRDPRRPPFGVLFFV